MNWFLLIFSFISFTVFSQLKCTEKLVNGESVKTCFHKTKGVSSTESWDREKRFGNFRAFDYAGNEIINYSLRSIGGHASVYVSYYSNGQIRQLEYSSAPDGGIQSYRYIHKFDENGKQTDYQDLSLPDGRPDIIIRTVPDTLKQVKPRAIPNIKDKTTVFRLVNSSPYRISLKFQDSLIMLKRNRSITLHTSELRDHFLSPVSYAPELLLNRKMKKKCKLIPEELKVEDKQGIYTWYIVLE